MMRTAWTLATLLLLGLAGCATSGAGGTPALRDEIAGYKADFERCTNDMATRMIEQTDFDPQTIATTAIDRCDSSWQAYTDGLQRLYTRQTRNITYGHLQSRSEGFALNNHQHRVIKQRAEAERADAAAPAS